MPYKKNFILIIIMPTLLSIIYLNYTTNYKVIKDQNYTKKHENKKEVLDDSYLIKFMKTNLDLNKVIS